MQQMSAAADQMNGRMRIRRRGALRAPQQQRRSVITRLLSGGLATDYCVHQTARDTLQQDVGVEVARVTAQVTLRSGTARCSRHDAGASAR